MSKQQLLFHYYSLVYILGYGHEEPIKLIPHGF